ncbi:hypothetical protein [Deinococcus maricopensis]|uniref:NfeD-like C-terminal domain-containing protein n=1 Tax=Deinococcus maricopensis (strain DSM 21211 / LMG 22137 / NRRL B-23946 / LB-34) TaxID=709986 RepID=E8UA82_DEIML|nr:hypothetical protein [Deinococcus maricopensis]ADV67971.1 hypothetical protein Deima_2333 [Deinococcus maricopensis DSM 21211]
MVYLLLLLVGGALLLLSLLTGHDHDFGAGHADAGEVASWLSVRAVVAFAAFFGLGGVVAGALGYGGAAQFAYALAAGLPVSAFAAWLTRVARTRGEVHTGAGRVAGRVGIVRIRPEGARPGKVEVIMAGQSTQHLALSDDALNVGEQVIVIGIERGVLHVRRWDGR